MNLTQSAPQRQETFTPEPCETSGVGREGASGGRAVSKLHKRPEYVTVPRAALKHERLDVRDALAYGLVVYRDRIGSRIGASEIGEVFGWDRTTGWRALVRLREVGLLDAEDAPIAGALPEVGGFLKVRVEHVRELGSLEAVVLVQLQTFGQLRMSKLVGRHMVVTARGLSSLIGCCADTALSVLERLSTGLTVRVKRLQRKGSAWVAKARVELVRALGQAARVRILSEREQNPQGAGKGGGASAAPGSAPASASVARPAENPAVYVPSREELAAMIRARRPERAAAPAS